MMARHLTDSQSFPVESASFPKLTAAAFKLENGCRSLQNAMPNETHEGWHRAPQEVPLTNCAPPLPPLARSLLVSSTAPVRRWYQFATLLAQALTRTMTFATWSSMLGCGASGSSQSSTRPHMPPAGMWATPVPPSSADAQCSHARPVAWTLAPACPPIIRTFSIRCRTSPSRCSPASVRALPGPY